MFVSPPPDRAVQAPFPVLLDLAGHPVVVVGDGAGAVAKCRLLTRSGAVVRLVAAEPDAALRSMIAVGQVHPAGPDLTASVLAGARLCVVALEDDASSTAAVALARACHVLVNAVDRPALCDCTIPAIVDGAPLARSLRERIARRRFWDALVAGLEAALRGRLQAARGAPAGPSRGRASLVGAGPGDPELLTLRAVRALQGADVILYDALIDPAILDYARRDARRIDVGKRCGRHALQQAAINRLILEHARNGAHVVRLKGGDPFVFGRGGEELEALRAAGIEVAIIPGVTAACAAAAALGLPLTHRGLARSLHFVTGHGADGRLPEQDWSALIASGGTIVAYMGLRTLPELAARLICAGLPGATPAAAVENASRPDERRVFATLAGLADALAGAGVSGPTLVLIGAVVTLAETGEPARLIA